MAKKINGGNGERGPKAVVVGTIVMELVRPFPILRIKFDNVGQLLIMVVGCTVGWRWRKSNRNSKKSSNSSRKESISYRNNIERILMEMEMEMEILMETETETDTRIIIVLAAVAAAASGQIRTSRIINIILQ